MYSVAKHCHIPGRTKTEEQIQVQFVHWQYYFCCEILNATNILLYLIFELSHFIQLLFHTYTSVY